MRTFIFLYDAIITVTTKTEAKFPFGVVLGISCCGLLLLGIIYHYLPCSALPTSQKGEAEALSKVVLYPGEERFELEDKKEGIGRYGEVAISSIEACFEGGLLAMKIWVS